MDQQKKVSSSYNEKTAARNSKASILKAKSKAISFVVLKDIRTDGGHLRYRILAHRSGAMTGAKGHFAHHYKEKSNPICWGICMLTRERKLRVHTEGREFNDVWLKGYKIFLHELGLGVPPFKGHEQFPADEIADDKLAQLASSEYDQLTQADIAASSSENDHPDMKAHYANLSDSPDGNEDEHSDGEDLAQAATAVATSQSASDSHARKIFDAAYSRVKELASLQDVVLLGQPSISQIQNQLDVGLKSGLKLEDAVKRMIDRIQALELPALCRILSLRNKREHYGEILSQRLWEFMEGKHLVLPEEKPEKPHPRILNLIATAEDHEPNYEMTYLNQHFSSLTDKWSAPEQLDNLRGMFGLRKLGRIPGDQTAFSLFKSRIDALENRISVAKEGCADQLAQFKERAEQLLADDGYASVEETGHNWNKLDKISEDIVKLGISASIKTFKNAAGDTAVAEVIASAEKGIEYFAEIKEDIEDFEDSYIGAPTGRFDELVSAIKDVKDEFQALNT